jgi:hypothetical protein
MISQVNFDSKVMFLLECLSLIVRFLILEYLVPVKNLITLVFITSQNTHRGLFNFVGI